MASLSRDGVSLFYEQAGAGAPAIVLIHCWGGDHSFMAPQFEYFSRSHRVVTLDLRGFGRSDRPQQSYRIADFADDVAWIVGQLGVEKPVLVGHSMGGSIALDIAARHPELPAAIAILEGPVVTPPPLLDAFRPVLAAIRTPAYAEAMRQFTDQLLGPHFDDEGRRRCVEHMAANDPHVLVSALEGVLAFDSESAAQRCKVPTLYASSGPWYTDVERFRGYCPQLVTCQAVGCGHYFQLEVPDQVNAMIERFIRVSVVSG